MSKILQNRPKKLYKISQISKPNFLSEQLILENATITLPSTGWIGISEVNRDIGLKCFSVLMEKGRLTNYVTTDPECPDPPLSVNGGLKRKSGVPPVVRH